MNYLHDVGQSLTQHQREIERIMRENLLLRQLHEEKSRQSVAEKQALRVRFGRFLIRLGEQLAA